MAANSDNVYSFGGDDSAVWVAPKAGWTPPTDLGTPVGMVDVGWLTDDGIDFDDKMSVNKIKGHQGGKVVKILSSDRELSFKFSLMEDTAVTLGITHPGIDLVNNGGIVSGTIKGSATYDARAWVIDEWDQSNTYVKRYVIRSGSIDPSKTITYKAGETAAYDVVVNVEGDVELITNLPAIVASVTPATDPVPVAP